MAGPEQKGRRVLRLVEGRVEVGHESRFDSEQQLHRAVAAHPEVLPSEDLGLGPLTRVAEELDLGHGPLDLLAVDPAGRLVIVEFKRGSESDVRQVVAQMLDYGSRLWRLPYDDLEQHALEGQLPDEQPAEDLAGLVSRQLERLGKPPVTPDAFRNGVQRQLDKGDFVFLYVARDLDERTRSVLTYLADGARLSCFAVEIDRFCHGDGSSVLVPRTAFLPSWVTAPQVRPDGGRKSTFAERLATAPVDVQEVTRRMEALASGLRGVLDDSVHARHLRPASGSPGVAVYTSDRKLWFDLSRLRRDRPEVARQVVDELSRLSGRVQPAQFPNLACSQALEHWSAVAASIRTVITEQRPTASAHEQANAPSRSVALQVVEQSGV